MNDGWEHILDKDEEIVWQGRPSGDFSIKPRSIGMAIFALFFTSFAVFWIIQAAQTGSFFWMFGLLHLSVGVGMLAHSVFGDTYIRRHSWYTLTDRRAIIASEMPFRGRRLKSYPIRANTKLELEENGPFVTINFAEDAATLMNGSQTKPAGFQRLKDGRTVFGLMRDIQAGKRDE
ncbi:MAG: aspartate carbamoyltransferase catalytic subunit [Pseudomonadota bacterium]